MLLAWLPEDLTGQESGFRIQVVATADAGAAEALRSALELGIGDEHGVYVVEQAGLLKVRVGDFASRTQAGGALASVRDMGYADAWVTADEIMMARGGGGGGGGGAPRARLAVPTPIDGADARSRMISRSTAAPAERETRASAQPTRDVARENEAAADETRPLQREPRASVPRDRTPTSNVEATELRAREDLSMPTGLALPRSEAIDVFVGRLERQDRERLVQAAPIESSERIESSDASERTPPVEAPRRIEREETPRVADRGSERDAAPAETSDEPASGLPFVDRNAIRADGTPNEAAWSSAIAVVAQSPMSASSQAPSTELRFAYDDRAFFIAAAVRHVDARQLDPRRAPGDQERIVVTLEKNGETARSFGVTLSGVRIEYADAQARHGEVWSAGTAVGRSEWTAEVRVPFRLLDMDQATADRWRVSVRWEDPRGIPTAGRLDLPMQQFGMVWRPGFGRLAVTPFIQTAASRTSDGAPWGSSASRAGAEVQLEVGDNFRLRGALQPDYSEALPDPASVNLTPYETRFRENRAFFEDDGRAPDWGPELFYSRRIGGAPGHIRAPGGLERLVDTNVLGVGAASGQTERIEYRFLTAVADRASVAGGAGEGLPFDLSPTTWFGMGQVRQSVTDGGGTLGSTLTVVSRSLDGSLQDVLASEAFAGLFDLDLPLAGGARLRGFVGFSHLVGSETAIRTLSESSAHYLQRPDADHTTLEVGAGALSGYTAGLKVGRTGTGLDWFVSAAAESPGYDVRDMGYMRSSDDVDVDGWVGWSSESIDQRRVGLGLGGHASWNFGGVRQALSPQVRVLTGSDAWEASLTARYHASGLSDELTRGGPLMATPGGWSAGFEVSGNRGAGLVAAAVHYATDALGGRWIRSSIAGSLHAGDHLMFSLEPGVYSATDPRQYVMDLDGGPEATFDRRYVFASLDHSEAYLRLGLEVAPLAGLRFSAYAEPFISAGRFSEFGQLAQAGGLELLRFGDDGTAIASDGDAGWSVDTPSGSFGIPGSDFTVRSFRAQLNLAVDLLDAGTLSVTWRQARSAFEDRYFDAGPGSLSDAFGDFGRSLLVARMSYRLRNH